MHKKDIFFIRRMTQGEVESIALDWAAAEGWNPGVNDAACFYKADPNGFLVGMLDDIPVACISAVAYDEYFGFIGFYIVKPEYRGKGYGIRIWEAGINYLNTQNVGLDGVVAQQANYAKSGFRLAYRNIRYEGTARKSNVELKGIVQYPEVSTDDILSYDSTLFPARRDEFIECWINQPGGKALASISNGIINGYAVIRKCRVGYKIGPLFADSEKTAGELFAACNNFAEEGSPVFLDVPEINSAAVKLAENYGMKKVFETARMYTKMFPAIDINKIYGVTTFELG